MPVVLGHRRHADVGDALPVEVEPSTPSAVRGDAIGRGGIRPAWSTTARRRSYGPPVRMISSGWRSAASPSSGRVPWSKEKMKYDFGLTSPSSLSESAVSSKATPPRSRSSLKTASAVRAATSPSDPRPTRCGCRPSRSPRSRPVPDSFKSPRRTPHGMPLPVRQPCRVPSRRTMHAGGATSHPRCRVEPGHAPGGRDRQSPGPEPEARAGAPIGTARAGPSQRVPCGYAGTSPARVRDWYGPAPQELLRGPAPERRTRGAAPSEGPGAQPQVGVPGA